MGENAKWRIEDINFGAVDRSMVKADERLFYLLASSSFVEILSEVYSANLAEHYEGNLDAARWLKEVWQREEVRHGEALRAYVLAVWPEFDWEKSYSGFAEEYSRLCSMENLESSRALEMIARCVVETGTSTLYRCLHDSVEEPVLKKLLANIKTDEVRHYSRFKRLFIEHNSTDHQGFFPILRVIRERLLEIRGEDGYIAFKHAHLCRSENPENLEADWKKFRKSLNSLVLEHYPFRMAVEMLLSPVPVSPRIKKPVEGLLTGSAKFAVFGLSFLS